MQIRYPSRLFIKIAVLCVAVAPWWMYNIHTADMEIVTQATRQMQNAGPNGGETVRSAIHELVQVQMRENMYRLLAASCSACGLLAAIAVFKQSASKRQSS